MTSSQKFIISFLAFATLLPAVFFIYGWIYYWPEERMDPKLTTFIDPEKKWSTQYDSTYFKVSTKQSANQSVVMFTTQQPTKKIKIYFHITKTNNSKKINWNDPPFSQFKKNELISLSPSSTEREWIKKKYFFEDSSKNQSGTLIVGEVDHFFFSILSTYPNSTANNPKEKNIFLKKQADIFYHLKFYFNL